MTRRLWLAGGGAALLALGTLGVLAQQGGTYYFTGHSIPGGGGRSATGDYEVAGAIGQAFAGTVQGSGYVIDSGFFGGAPDTGPEIFELYAPGLSAQP